jgi:hypothetical protein
LDAFLLKISGGRLFKVAKDLFLSANGVREKFGREISDRAVLEIGHCVERQAWWQQSFDANRKYSRLTLFL